METFSRPPPEGTSDCAGPEASWGHRKDNRLHRDDELFYGCYLSAAIMMPGEHGPPVPEYARRITVSSCRRDPVPAFVPVLTVLPAPGIPPGDILAAYAYAYAIPANWAIELPRVFRTGNLRLFNAAACPFRYSSRTSCGVRYPSVEWRRVLL
jgi:hypothetical protein